MIIVHILFLKTHCSMKFPEWTQCKDAKTGMPYYYNIATKEVTWDMPNEYERFLRYALIQYPNQLVQWSVCHTEDNSKYYFNEFTREISWEKPDDFIEAKTNDTVNTSSLVAAKDNNVSELAPNNVYFSPKGL